MFAWAEVTEVHCAAPDDLDVAGGQSQSRHGRTAGGGHFGGRGEAIGGVLL